MWDVLGSVMTGYILICPIKDGRKLGDISKYAFVYLSAQIDAYDSLSRV